MCYVFSNFRILDVRAQFVLNFQVGSKLKGRPQKREAARPEEESRRAERRGPGRPGLFCIYIGIRFKEIVCRTLPALLRRYKKKKSKADACRGARGIDGVDAYTNNHIIYCTNITPDDTACNASSVHNSKTIYITTAALHVGGSRALAPHERCVRATSSRPSAPPCCLPWYRAAGRRRRCGDRASTASPPPAPRRRARTSGGPSPASP